MPSTRSTIRKARIRTLWREPERSNEPVTNHVARRVNESGGVDMKRLEKKHPLAIRWFHWINFPVLMVMIWSGLLIYWANDVYHIGPWHLFPDWFYTRFHFDQRLAEGMAWHFFFMWFFVVNGLLYVLYTAFSGEWHYLLPNRHSFREAVQVVLNDLHLSKVHPPRRKFNGAQQVAYTSIILMGAGSLLTGLAIYKPIQFAWLTSLLGGYPMALSSISG